MPEPARSAAPDLETLLDEHGPWLRLFARSLGLTEPDADVAVHDAFTALWLRLREGVAIETPGAYLATIVRNARRVRGPRAAERSLQGADFVAADPARPLDRDVLAAALATLPDEQREVIVLRTWAGLTFEQIGLALGIPMNTAASRHRYALRRLRDHFEHAPAAETRP